MNTALILSLNAQTQPENPSFEDWEDVGLPVEEPVNWSSIKTSDNPTTNAAAPIVWDKSTDAHLGNFSLKLLNVETIVPGLVASGTVTNGRVHADFNPDLAYVFTDVNDPQWNSPCSDRPDSIVVWIKYYPEQNDLGTIRALMHTGYAKTPDTTQTNWVGLAEFDFTGTIDVWTRFSAPFNYYNNDTPDYILINMYSGNGTNPVKGSWALVDDVELIYNPSGIDEKELTGINIYSQNNSIIVNWKSQSAYKDAGLIILDLSGRTIWEDKISVNQTKTVYLDVPKGIYICRIASGHQHYTQKIIIP